MIKNKRNTIAMFCKLHTESAGYQQIKKALDNAGFKNVEDLIKAYQQVKAERDAAVKAKGSD